MCYTLVSVLFLLSACAPDADRPPAILPDQAPEETVTPAARAETDDDTAILPTPTETITEDATDAVIWNPDEAPLSLQPVAAGLTRPLFVAHAGDGSGLGVVRTRRTRQVRPFPGPPFPVHLSESGARPRSESHHLCVYRYCYRAVFGRHDS